MYVDCAASAPAVGRELLQLQEDYHQKILICSCLCGPSSVVPGKKQRKQNNATLFTE